MVKTVWKHYLFSSLPALAIGILFYSTIPVLSQSTQVPMTLEFGEGMYTMTVPDQDTTRSAYGGQLRLYDVHIAKMFEVTYDDCSRMNAGSRTWFYKAGNGSINMGQFNISCNLANSIARTYGLGQDEITFIREYREQSGQVMTKRPISILDITGSKVSQWIDFVEGFKPVR